MSCSSTVFPPIRMSSTIIVQRYPAKIRSTESWNTLLSALSPNGILRNLYLPNEVEMWLVSKINGQVKFAKFHLKENTVAPDNCAATSSTVCHGWCGLFRSIQVFWIDAYSSFLFVLLVGGWHPICWLWDWRDNSFIVTGMWCPGWTTGLTSWSSVME